MNRRGDGAYIEAMLNKLRARIPGVVMRTSLITGLPGEGEAEFTQLCEFLKRQRMERVGTFAYSPEEGTPAAEMERPDEDVARERAKIIEQLQSRVMDDWCLSKLGEEIEVLCEGFDETENLYYGRSRWDSPDIDSKVWFESVLDVAPGTFVTVAVEQVKDGELMGTCIGEVEG